MTERQEIYKNELERLDKLAQSNISEYRRELLKPWVGMEADFEMFKGIVFEYHKKTGESLKLLENFHESDDLAGLNIEMPKWHSVVIEAFDKAYGQYEGQFRFFKANALFATLLLESVE